MAKRKAQSDSSREQEFEKSPKKRKNSISQSFVQAANFMSKSNILHKSLNLSSSLVFPNIDNNEKNKKTLKVKKKRKEEVSSSGSSESESDKRDTKQTEYNEEKLTTNNITKNSPKKKKSKTPEKKTKKRSFDAFTPKILLKEEHVQESESDNEVGSEDNNIANNSGNLSLGRDDSMMMNSIEKKIEKARISREVNISPTKGPEQQLKNAYPNLKLQKIKTDIKSDSDTHIFLFRIPKNIDPKTLVNVDINLEGGKINIGEKYVIRPTSKTPHPTLVVGKTSKILRFKQNIVMEKYIKTPKDPKLPVSDKSSVPLPNDLKNRHPLFGTNFEEKIQLDKMVEKKLSSAIKNLLKQEKKAGKKKIKTDLEEEKDELVFSLLASKTTAENGRKMISNKPVSASTPNKPVKKKRMTKHDLIEETLRLMKQELHTEYETDSGLGPHKKKNKKKYSHNGVSPNVSVKQENDFSKANRRLSIKNSTMLPNETKIPAFNPEVSSIFREFSEEITPKRKKIHKNKSKNMSDVSNSEENLINELPKLKKHKIKKEPEEVFRKTKKKRKDLNMQ